MIIQGSITDDALFGTPGVRDTFIGFQGNDTFNGNGDRDTADYSFDVFVGGQHGIRVNLSAEQPRGGLGTDSAIDSFGFTDHLPGVQNVIGTRFADVVYGGGHANHLIGGRGNDILQGFRGKDTLEGDVGKDKLSGGKGADVFVYKTAKDSTVAAKGRDTINDFSANQHDKIHLKAIDANTTTAGNQAFSFIGQESFHHQAGELRYETRPNGSFVYGDRNGDGNADFAIFLKGLAVVDAGYFVL
jgi:Ca2+-binding RTX toxin-like protein